VISGVVSGRQALIRLSLRDPGGQEVPIDFVLDTGFAGYLVLPQSMVAALSLPYSYPAAGYLADGTGIQIPAYDAAVLWDGEERVVEVLATGRDPLLGMALLDGCDLHVEVTDGGLVAIDTL
jgi:clan AA aspartic protease